MHWPISLKWGTFSLEHLHKMISKSWHRSKLILIRRNYHTVCDEFNWNKYNMTKMSKLKKTYFLTQMGKIFNCSMPFLEPDTRYEECKLDSMEEHERTAIYSYFMSSIIFLIIFNHNHNHCNIIFLIILNHNHDHCTQLTWYLNVFLLLINTFPK